jgi:hypothetical protein
MAIITLRQMRQMPYTEIDEKKLYTKINTGLDSKDIVGNVTELCALCT